MLSAADAQPASLALDMCKQQICCMQVHHICSIAWLVHGCLQYNSKCVMCCPFARIKHEQAMFDEMMHVAIEQADRCKGKNCFQIDLDDLLVLLQKKALCGPKVSNSSIIDCVIIT